MKVATLLVTGAAGFIGSHLAERLVNLGYHVVGLDNFDNYYSPAIKWNNIRTLKTKDGFHLEQGDIRDTSLLNRIFEANNIEAVVHLAARAGVRPSLEQPLLYQDINVGGTVNLLEASRLHGVKQFIFTSSSSVYGINGNSPFKEEQSVNCPLSPYAASKAAAELFCRTYSHLYGIATVVIRPFTVYGPRQRPEMAIHHFVNLIDCGEEITIFGDGDTSRDYTNVGDIVSGLEAALTHRLGSFQVFNLGAGRAVEIGYLIKVIEEALGKKAKIRHVAPPPGEVPTTLADISRARAMLGYQPRISIEEGVSNFVQWYLTNMKVAA
jgi:UDP-glucuronate 4-epimerase